MSPSLPQFEIRPMRWWDIAAIRTIEISSFPHSAWSAETFWAELARVPETREYFVAEKDDDVLGYAGVMTVGADADVQTLAVTQLARRHGIGGMLMQRLIATATSRGSTRMFLEVAAENGPAIALYERLKFRVSVQRTDYYGAGLHAVVMQADLVKPSSP